MCGIAGYIRKDSVNDNIAKDIKSKIDKSIYHRGPDGSGKWFNNDVLFLHRRLKIIDLDDNANQPMVSSNQKQIIIFNGEIYNYRELAEKHLANYNFNTKSDTEVLLALFEKYGEKCVDFLNGIFAFAIYDIEKKVVCLFRDHFGVKPLYYSMLDDSFIFCSEIKGVFKLGVKAEINNKHIAEQLCYGYVAGKNTIYKNIKRLEPGQKLIIPIENIEKYSISNYFDLSTNNYPAVRKVDDKIILKKLKNAIKRQMISDVPVGFMASGGIDSSAIAHLSSKLSKESINTYCAKIIDESSDESSYAKILSNQINSSHHEINSSSKDISKLLPSLIWAHDEPLKHPNSIAIYQVNKIAKEKVTVLLTGEGADEIFAGYWVFPLIKKINFLRKIIPKILMKYIYRLSRYFGKQGKFAYTLFSNSVADMFLRMSSVIDIESFKNFLKVDNIDISERKKIAELSVKNSEGDILQAFQFYYQKTHLISLFDRQDKMSMINALEGRVPFLDIDLVEAANALTYDQKISGSETKLILRQAMDNILPEEILRRSKHPFGLPIEIWVKECTEFRKMLHDVKKGWLVKNGILIESEYIKMLNKFINGDGGLGDIMWNILNLDLAARIFIDCEELVDWNEFKYRKFIVDE